MNRPQLSFLRLFALLLSLAFAAPAHADQGAKREDRKAVAALDRFSEAISLDGLPESVDLRPYLPEVGAQTMNDCAAWAFGYAARSYLEAIDQGWRPDSDERIFSPTFIYNQVNDGVDHGSRVDKVLDLLMNQGAATLKTAPYLAKDYLTQPPGISKLEAENFRIADFVVLPDGPTIRRALAEGHIVLCCVRTNPIFSSGHSRPYTKEEHTRGQAARRPDQPHGFHAMAIVGYSDQRQAYLFMNSWGKQWGEDGFLWVSYDVLDRFNNEQETTNLMDFALVMLDRREPVVKVNGSYKVVQFESLQAHVFAAYAGRDPQADVETWRYTVSLRGKADALKYVKKVDWNVPGVSGSQIASTENSQTAFRVTGRSPQPKIAISGVATMSNGTQVKLSAETEVPDSMKRDLQVKRIDAFHRETEDGIQTWRWTLMPQMSDANWRELQSIEWAIYTESAEFPNKTYQHDGGLPPQWSFDSLAMPSFHTSKPFAGVGRFRFRDGSLQVAEFHADDFTAEPIKYGKFDYVTRPEGVDGARGWHYLEMRALYPEAWKDNIMGVRMGAGTSATWHSGQARQIGGPEPYMHVYSTYVDGPFWPDSMIFFRTPGALGRSTPAMTNGPIILPESAAWHDPWPDGKNLDSPGRGYGLNYRDRFAGFVNGKPQWEVMVFLDGNANLGIVEQIEWKFDEHVQPNAELQTKVHNWEKHLFQNLLTSAPFSATATCTDYNGFNFDLTIDVQPRSTMNTALSVDLTAIPVPELAEQTPNQSLADVSLVGLSHDIQGVRSVKAWAHRSWGGVIPVQLGWWQYNQSPQPGFARIETSATQPTTFLLEYDDGSVTALQASPHSKAPVPTPTPLQVLVRERYKGVINGKPWWEVEAQLRGDQSLLNQATERNWSVKLQNREKIDLQSQQNSSAILFATSYPGKVTVELKFKEDEPPTKVSALVTTLAKRLPDRYEVRMEEGWFFDALAEAGPNADPWAIDQPPTPYRFRIVASEEAMARIKEVEYAVINDWELRRNKDQPEQALEPQLTTIAASWPDQSYFEHTINCTSDDVLHVTPTLTFQDGTKKALKTLVAGDLRRGVPWTPNENRPTVSVSDWGDVDGRRAALVRTSVHNGSKTNNLMRSELTASTPLTPAGNSPIASFDFGQSLREFLIFESTQFLSADLIRRDPWAIGFEEETLALRRADAKFPAAPAKPQILVRGDPGPGKVFFVRIAGPTSLLAQVKNVRYDMTVGGKRLALVPVTRLGESSENFEVRVYDAYPRNITARLYGDNGLLPGGQIQLK